jgi:hypothetical protein
MDKIVFKRQANRASKALGIATSEITKRELMDDLFEESRITGIKITMIDFELTDDAVVKSMTFGIGPGESPRIPNVSADTFWVNMIPAAARFICLVFENPTEFVPQLSMGTTPLGTDIFQSLPINPKANGKNGITTINVANVFSLQNPTSLFLHHGGAGDAWNEASLNLIFLFSELP